MAFKTFTSATLTSADVNTYLMKQTVIVCTSATRPTGVQGMVIYETDTHKLLVYTGATWSTLGPADGALTSWTPAVVQSGSVAVTVAYATYSRVGRMVFAQCQVVCTGTGTGANAVSISLPVPAQSTATAFCGTFSIFDASASTFYIGNARFATTTTLNGYANAQTAALGAASFTAALTTSDVVWISVMYEAAADA